MKQLPRVTAALHRQVARCLWRRAPSLPKTERLKALRKAELHSGLARALDANPDLGMAKSLSESAIPTLSIARFRLRETQARLNDAPPFERAEAEPNTANAQRSPGDATSASTPETSGATICYYAYSGDREGTPSRRLPHRDPTGWLGM